jgi:hypothetical protein
MSIRRCAIVVASAAVAGVSGVGIAAAAGGGGSTTPDTTSTPTTTQPRTPPPPPPQGDHHCPHGGTSGTGSTAPSGYPV